MCMSMVPRGAPVGNGLVFFLAHNVWLSQLRITVAQNSINQLKPCGPHAWVSQDRAERSQQHAKVFNEQPLPLRLCSVCCPDVDEVAGWLPLRSQLQDSLSVRACIHKCIYGGQNVGCISETAFL